MIVGAGVRFRQTVTIAVEIPTAALSAKQFELSAASVAFILVDLFLFLFLLFRLLLFHLACNFDLFLRNRRKFCGSGRLFGFLLLASTID